MLVIALFMACFSRAKISKKLWPTYFKIWPRCFYFECSGAGTDGQVKSIVFMLAMMETVLISHPGHVVASLNMKICDSYLSCSMESNKQQILTVKN